MPKHHKSNKHHSKKTPNKTPNKPAHKTDTWKIANVIRGTVSKKKLRWQNDGFDLDLSYVTSKIIAMGFPSSGSEGLYRNPLPEVQKFFKHYHHGHYKIYNLCSERSYPSSKFERVAIYPFDDHNPPPFELIPELCEDVIEFLNTSEEATVSIHCKAGKGRTGTMIACLLLDLGKGRFSPEQILDYYAQQRTKDGKGVTIKSQRRSPQ